MDDDYHITRAQKVCSAMESDGTSFGLWNTILAAVLGVCASIASWWFRRTDKRISSVEESSAANCAQLSGLMRAHQTLQNDMTKGQQELWSRINARFDSHETILRNLERALGKVEGRLNGETHK